MTMLIAGHETTAAVLTWTVYCLTSHPQVVARVHQEVSIPNPSQPHGLHVQHKCCEVFNLIERTPSTHMQVPAWNCLDSITDFAACSL